MSNYGRYSSGGGDSRDSRRHSSSRRSSPPRHHRSRRSPSPGPSRGRSSPRPRDPKTLPESFGRIQEFNRTEDDLNILQRMRTAYENSPLAHLYVCVRDNKKVKIWTRNYKEVRGVMTGYIIAFDKHWNLILRDVDEVYLKHKKNKTPFLRDVASNENLPDMPIKVPKEKKPEAESTATEPQPTTEPNPEASGNESEVTDKSGKKKQRKKKRKNTSEKRQVDKIFIRGDNVVMICPIADEGGDDESIEEGEETRNSD